LEKIQSIRRVEGPLQRALHVATVHADAAGRGVRAELRDRDVDEADRFFNQLVVQSRLARRRAAGSSPAPAPAMVAGNGSHAPPRRAVSPTVQPVPPPRRAVSAMGQPVPPPVRAVSTMVHPVAPPPRAVSTIGQPVPPPRRAVSATGQPVPLRPTGQPVPPPPA
jgi:hypothetical protein